MAESLSPAKWGMLGGGLVCGLAGLVLLLKGLAPVRQIFGLFGGAPPDAGFMDGLIADFKAGAVWAGIGLVLALAAVVLVKLALAQPKPPTVEEQVEAALRERFGDGVPQVDMEASGRVHAATQVKPLGLAVCPWCGGEAGRKRVCAACGNRLPR